MINMPLRQRGLDVWKKRSPSASWTLLVLGATLASTACGDTKLAGILAGKGDLVESERQALKTFVEANGLDPTKVIVSDEMGKCSLKSSCLLIKNHHLRWMVLNTQGIKNASALKAFPQLELIDLRGNAISTFVLPKMKHLIKIDLTRNPLKSLDVRGCSKLKLLDLQNTRIESTAGIADLPVLASLDLRDTPIRTRPHLVGVPKTVDIFLVSGGASSGAGGSVRSGTAGSRYRGTGGYHYGK